MRVLESPQSRIAFKRRALALVRLLRVHEHMDVRPNGLGPLPQHGAGEGLFRGAVRLGAPRHGVGARRVKVLKLLLGLRSHRTRASSALATAGRGAIASTRPQPVATVCSHPFFGRNSPPLHMIRLAPWAGYSRLLFFRAQTFWVLRLCPSSGV